MVTGTMSQYKNSKDTSGSWMAAILKGGLAMIKNLVSVILLSITSIFFLWVNGKQSEYDDLEDNPKH
jgi:hypothetical protein